MPSDLEVLMLTAWPLAGHRASLGESLQVRKIRISQAMLTCPGYIDIVMPQPRYQAMIGAAPDAP